MLEENRFGKAFVHITRTAAQRPYLFYLISLPTEPVCEQSLHVGVHTSVTSLMLLVIREVPIPSLCRHGFRSSDPRYRTIPHLKESGVCIICLSLVCTAYMCIMFGVEN